MSCTDKNTMVFVVLEGEITVILHTTQFNAKKGDSFYIPPKVFYIFAFNFILAIKVIS
jgi:mannose-6-phosphate isomerase-like protein (cupin superfamily)